MGCSVTIQFHLVQLLTWTYCFDYASLARFLWRLRQLRIRGGARLHFAMIRLTRGPQKTGIVNTSGLGVTLFSSSTPFSPAPLTFEHDCICFLALLTQPLPHIAVTFTINKIHRRVSHLPVASLIHWRNCSSMRLFVLLILRRFPSGIASFTSPDVCRLLLIVISLTIVLDTGT